MGTRTTEAGGKTAGKSRTVFAANASVSGRRARVKSSAIACNGKKSKITGKNIDTRIPKACLFNLPPTKVIKFLFYSDKPVTAYKQKSKNAAKTLPGRQPHALLFRFISYYFILFYT